jgi:hypothetical protein
MSENFDNSFSIIINSTDYIFLACYRRLAAMLALRFVIKYSCLLRSSQASILLVDIVVCGCLKRIRLSEFTCLEGFLDSNYMIVR